MLAKCHMALLLLALLFPSGNGNTDLSNSVCTANATTTTCNKWIRESSWTQGGYYTTCEKKFSADEFHLTVFIVRNVYRCKNGNRKENVVKIVNSYFDGEGKLCHLSHGDNMCPGVSKSKKSYKYVMVSLYCGDFACSFRYKRCDMCPLVPWYTWSAADKLKRERSCVKRSFLSPTRRRSRKGICVKCDGSWVNNRFCRQRGATQYFVDLTRSKPSWSKWLRVTECRVNKTKQACGNGTSSGSASWTKQCRYADSLVKLNPKYCGSEESTMNLRCDITLSPCHGKVLSKTSIFFKRARTWLIVLAIFLVVAFLAAVCIYFRYLRLVSKTNGSSYNFLSTGLFSSCVTQTSPNYSPRRIMSEPEYALLGDWRHNVAKCPQTGKYSFTDDGDMAYWGSEHHLLSDDCLSDSNDEIEKPDPITKSGLPAHHSLGPHLPNERCELEASKRRAFFAKSSTSSQKVLK